MLKKIQYCDVCRSVVDESQIVRGRIPKKNKYASFYIGRGNYDYIKEEKEVDVCNNCLRRYLGLHVTASADVENGQVTIRTLEEARENGEG
jgi:hypothetical protein